MLLPALDTDGRARASSADSPSKRELKRSVQAEGYGSPTKKTAGSQAELPQEARGRSPELLASSQKEVSSSPPAQAQGLSSARKPPRTPGERTPSKGNSSRSASKRSATGRQSSLPPVPGSTPHSQRTSRSPASRPRMGSQSPMTSASWNHGNATPSTVGSRTPGRRPSRKRRTSGTDPEADPDLAKVLGFVALASEVVDAFLAGLFLECATAMDSAGQPVMSGQDLQAFLGKFFGLEETGAIEAGMISYNSICRSHLVEHHDGRIGLANFRQVLNDIEKAMPLGYVSRIISQRHFACCGNADLLARAMKIGPTTVPGEQPMWKP